MHQFSTSLLVEQSRKLSRRMGDRLTTSQARIDRCNTRIGETIARVIESEDRSRQQPSDVNDAVELKIRNRTIIAISA